ncbi:Uracil-DNA glycosylase [Chlamydiales bacterium STE3]|nr:Uracil-DNA glycosylase [Chlamydiales bacterium STE3]
MIPFELEPSWQAALKEELSKPYILQLKAFVESERAALPNAIYPPKDLVFNAFWKTPFDKVKVVIVGQDPYHGPGQAHGLSFSVPENVPAPPSLQNIFKEIQADLHKPSSSKGCLLSWAEQGVLLLNTLLTVRRGAPLSHQKKGWEQFTDAVLRQLADSENPIVFVLWGRSAQEKYANALKSHKSTPHLVLKAAHPSPFSAHNGFFGCKHFSKINDFLIQHEKKPIQW